MPSGSGRAAQRGTQTKSWWISSLRPTQRGDYRSPAANPGCPTGLGTLGKSLRCCQVPPASPGRYKSPLGQLRAGQPCWGDRCCSCLRGLQALQERGRSGTWVGGMPWSSQCPTEDPGETGPGQRCAPRASTPAASALRCSLRTGVHSWAGDAAPRRS